MNDTYLAKPLVVHRAAPTTRAEIVARKTHVAKHRLFQNYNNAGKKKYRSIVTKKLLNTNNKLENINNSILFDTIQTEIQEAIRVGGGLDQVVDQMDNGSDDKDVPATLLTREEKIAMHAIRKKEKLKEKAGGVPPAVVNYVPPVPRETLEKLLQLNEANEKMSKQQQASRHSMIVPSMEMIAALSQQITGDKIKKRRRSRSSRSNRSSMSNRRTKREEREMREKEIDTLQTDFWENRLTSELARPLGIEAFIQSQLVPSSSSSSSSSTNKEFISDSKKC